VKIGVDNLIGGWSSFTKQDEGYPQGAEGRCRRDWQGLLANQCW
jgi:hypothetical protein